MVCVRVYVCVYVSCLDLVYSWLKILPSKLFCCDAYILKVLLK